MKKNVIRTIKNYISIDRIVYLLFFLFVVVNFATTLLKTPSYLVSFSFLIIACMGIYCYFLDNKAFSIDKIISIFVFLFCYLAPHKQFVQGHSYYGLKIVFTWRHYFIANLMIVSFLLLYIAFRKVNEDKKAEIIKNEKASINLNVIALVVLSIGQIISLLILYWMGVLFDTGINESKTFGTIGSFFIKIIRFVPVACFLIYIYTKKVNQIKADFYIEFFFLLLTVFSLIIIYFPLNGTIGRFYLFGVYLIVASSLFKNFKYKSALLVIAFLGFSIIFQSFNFFKHNSLNNLEDFKLSSINLLASDYDAYYMFLLAIKYVEEQGVLFFSNLITALLCFVPRSIWTSKNVHSGELITSFYSAKFTNVACPIFAEFYLAGGMLSLLIGGVILAILVEKLNKHTKYNILMRGMEDIAIGIFISFLRGALLPVMTFWIAWIVSYIGIYGICKFTGGITVKRRALY